VRLLILSLICLAPLLLAGVVALIYFLTRSNGARYPYCAERIRPEATVCPHCGRELPKGETEEA